MNIFFKLLLVTTIIISLTACETIRKGSGNNSSDDETAVTFKPSNEAIANPNKSDYLFVQTALTRLGFKPGPIDGFWGKRSQKALDNFHRTRELPIDGGVITEADIYYLERLTNIQRNQFTADGSQWQSNGAKTNPALEQKDAVKNPSITGTEKAAPKLIIVEQTTDLLRSDNPFSRVLAQLQPGTSMYVLKRTAQWLLVETEDRVRGYIILN